MRTRTTLSALTTVALALCWSCVGSCGRQESDPAKPKPTPAASMGEPPAGTSPPAVAQAPPDTFPDAGPPSEAPSSTFASEWDLRPPDTWPRDPAPMAEGPLPADCEDYIQLQVSHWENRKAEYEAGGSPFNVPAPDIERLRQGWLRTLASQGERLTASSCRAQIMRLAHQMQ